MHSPFQTERSCLLVCKEHCVLAYFLSTGSPPQEVEVTVRSPQEVEVTGRSPQEVEITGCSHVFHHGVLGSAGEIIKIIYTLKK